LTEARGELERAAAAAEPLGPEGYETRIAALLMLGKILAALDRASMAEGLFERVIAECRARGDQLHLAAALNNRTSLWFALRDEQRAVADLLEFIRVGRELGMTSIEEVGEYNLAVLRFRQAEIEAARTHLDRVLGIVEKRGPGDAFRAAVLLLDARLFWHAGDEQKARAAHQRLRLEEDAHLASKGHGSLLPSFRVISAALELALRRDPSPASTGCAAPAASGDWNALEAEASAYPSELAEVLEMRGLVAQSSGLASESRAFLERALAAANRAASPVRLRIARALEASECRTRTRDCS
jgi:tetratricopeptide (TPR) repeat protein